VLGSYLRGLVGRYAFTLDGYGHRLHLPEPLSHNVCLAADVTVGWGPGCEDWERQRTRFLRWFYRWFWNGACPSCGGRGQIEIWRSGDPSDDFHTETCYGCDGSGRMDEEIVAAI